MKIPLLQKKDEGNDWDEEVIRVGQVYPCCILTSFTYPMGHICVWRCRKHHEGNQTWEACACTKEIRSCLRECWGLLRWEPDAHMVNLCPRFCRKTRLWGNADVVPQEGNGRKGAGAWENFAAENTGGHREIHSPTLSWPQQPETHLNLLRRAGWH